MASSWTTGYYPVGSSTDSNTNCDSAIFQSESGPIPSNSNLYGPQAQAQQLPYLEIVVQPQSKFRFRYKSEMTGKHGSLLGVQNLSPNVLGGLGEHATGVNTQNLFTASCLIQNGAKVFPTVKLHNFPGEAIIRCSIVCESPPHYPHPHILDIGQRSLALDDLEVLGIPFVDIDISSENNHVAIFQGLNIIHTGKKYQRKELAHKISLLENYDLRKVQSEEEISNISLNANLNVVCLYFEALVRVTNESSQLILQPICPPVVSAPIQHNKSTQTSDLRIVRIDKYTSSVVGDEEVFIFVEKVDKHNIQIKFFQEDDKSIEIWKAYGRFSKLDVHHQYAIVFKTPPYRDLNSDTDIDVWLQLERPSDGATSLPIPFKYKPIERLRKMPKRIKTRNEGSGNHSPRPGSSSHDPSHQRNMQGEIRGFSPDGSSSGSSEGSNAPGSSSARQGSYAPKFPCDIHSLGVDQRERIQKALALNMALSVGESLHTWAQTSDFNQVLQRLRHLLCLVNQDGDNALHTAIINGQHEPFLRILTTVASSHDVSSIIDDRNLQGLTALCLAVLLNGEFFVQHLVQHKADLSITNSEGDTPIHLAVSYGHLNCLQILLQSPKIEESINRFNYSSLTPLHLAVSTDSLEAMELLLNAKASISVREGTFGRTPIHLAVEKENVLSTFLLLKSTGELCSEIVNIQNYRGDTPLHYAASSQTPSPVICSLLLYFGADPTIENSIKKSDGDDNDEVCVGNTVFDIATNQEIENLLKGTREDWLRIIKSCSTIIEYESRKDPVKLLSLDSLHIDSGIDIP